LEDLLIVLYFVAIVYLLSKLGSSDAAAINIGYLLYYSFGLCEFVLGHTETRRIPGVVEDKVEHDCQGCSCDEEDDSPVDQENTDESDDYLTQSPADRKHHRGRSSQHFLCHLGDRQQGSVVETSEASIEEEHTD
jgi:hypothetical protein